MAIRLVTRVTGRIPNGAVAVAIAVAMRGAYGLALGAGWASTLGRRLSGGRAGLALAGLIWVGELIGLPTVGATPALTRWRWTEILLDASNCLIFAAVVIALLEKGLGTAGATASARLRRDGR